MATDYRVLEQTDGDTVSLTVIEVTYTDDTKSVIASTSDYTAESIGPSGSTVEEFRVSLAAIDAAVESPTLNIVHIPTHADYDSEVPLPTSFASRAVEPEA